MDKELLQKYIEGCVNDQEKMIVTIWLDSDPENMREYFALRKLNDITIWQTSPVSIPDKKPKRSISVWTSRKIVAEFMKIAAILFFAILVSRYLFPEISISNPVVMQTIHVPAGQRAEITLVDGTKVWLNAKTTFTFPNYFSDNSRKVSLDGEGYFEVITDKSKPFIVNTEQYNVKVWGTKFNLIAYSTKSIFETSLFEGSVEVLNPECNKGVYLLPDERIYQKDNQLVKAPINDLNHFLWKEGILSFNDETFPELVEKLELYFDLKIEVKNNAILKYRCTGKFRMKDGVDHILKVLQLSNKFNFKIDEKTNTITID